MNDIYLEYKRKKGDSFFHESNFQIHSKNNLNNILQENIGEIKVFSTNNIKDVDAEGNSVEEITINSFKLINGTMDEPLYNIYKTLFQIGNKYVLKLKKNSEIVEGPLFFKTFYFKTPEKPIKKNEEITMVHQMTIPNFNEPEEIPIKYKFLDIIKNDGENLAKIEGKCSEYLKPKGEILTKFSIQMLIYYDFINGYFRKIETEFESKFENPTQNNESYIKIKGSSIRTKN